MRVLKKCWATISEKQNKHTKGMLITVNFSNSW
jgi:hypothetical protein